MGNETEKGKLILQYIKINELFNGFVLSKLQKTYQGGSK